MAPATPSLSVADARVALATALLDVIALRLLKYWQQSVAGQRAAAERQEKQLVEKKLIWHTGRARSCGLGAVTLVSGKPSH